MRYLYGDSTESTLEINYLAFLRDAVDFGVAVLQADNGLILARDRRSHRDRAAEDSARAIEAFGRSALQVTEPLAHGDQPVNRCAATVVQAIHDAVKREVGRVRAGQGNDLDQIVAELQRLREKCVSALGALLATHDLPDADETLIVQWGGTAYEAKMIQRVGFGLEVTIALEIAPSSLFGHDLKVEKVAEGAEVHAPETAGWVKKQLKMVPHKLGRHHVTHVTVSTAGTLVKVRATPEAGAAGFDILVARNGEVAVERAGRTENEATFETDERDLTGLRSLAAKLEAASDGLRGSRGALVSAMLDGKALASHEHPAVLVERLVATMAPVVNEIARHSLSPRELVLKRLLGGDRREEIFLSRAELTAKIEVLPIGVRRMFAPLGIVEKAGAPSVDVNMDDEDDDDEEPPRPMPAVSHAPYAPPNAPTLHAGVVHVAAHPPPAQVQAQAHAPAVVVEPAHAVATGVLTPTTPRAPSPPHEPGSAITIDAELPPVRVRPASLPPMPPASPPSTPRSSGKTVPPPAPPQRVSMAAAEAAVDAALRDLDDAEPTQVVSGVPRPPGT